MPEAKQPNYAIKWILGILSSLLITIVVGGTALLLRVDKAQALQDVRLQTITKELSQISEQLSPVVSTNATRVHDLERDVGDLKDDVEAINLSIKDLGDTVRLVGRNLEDKITGNP
jgi:hypothetical protein